MENTGIYIFISLFVVLCLSGLYELLTAKKVDDMELHHEENFAEYMQKIWLKKKS